MVGLSRRVATTRVCTLGRRATCISVDTSCVFEIRLKNVSLMHLHYLYYSELNKYWFERDFKTLPNVLNRSHG